MSAPRFLGKVVEILSRRERFWVIFYLKFHRRRKEVHVGRFRSVRRQTSATKNEDGSTHLGGKHFQHRSKPFSAAKCSSEDPLSKCVVTVGVRDYQCRYWSYILNLVCHDLAEPRSLHRNDSLVKATCQRVVVYKFCESIIAR